jgi:hypothetical protein
MVAYENASGALAVALVLDGTAAFAQDAVVEEPTEAESGNQASDRLVPAVVGVIILCALLCDDSDPAPTVRPVLD